MYMYYTHIIIRIQCMYMYFCMYVYVAPVYFFYVDVSRASTLVSSIVQIPTSKNQLSLCS